MKIRALFAGFLLVLAVGACGAVPTLPAPDPSTPSLNLSEPPPADSLSRTGGGMGSGN